MEFSMNEIHWYLTQEPGEDYAFFIVSIKPSFLGQFGRYKERQQCVKSVRIRSFSSPYFPAFGPENSEYGHFSRSAVVKKLQLLF